MLLSRKKYVLVGTVTAIMAIATFIVVTMLPGISITHAQTETGLVPPDSNMEITAGPWGTSISEISVQQIKIRADGTREEARVLDGRLENGRYVNADGSNPLIPDAEYVINLKGEKKKLTLAGLRDEPFEQVHTFQTITTPMMIDSASTLTAKYGEGFNLAWNMPIAGFEYELTGAESTANIEEDGRTVKITLSKFEQNKEYELRILSARSKDGVEMKEPAAVMVRTNPALTATFSPEDGSVGAGMDTRPAIEFSEPVADPQLVETAVTITPQVEGKFEWIDADSLQFVPAAPWEHQIDVTMRLGSGLEKLRGVSGSYIEQEIASTFTTAPDKSIEVDISEQTMTLFEHGQPVDTFLVTTGKAGHDTPLGDYVVYVKFDKLDMRGPDYFVPEVPWVMVFQGDYTVHGNYWATVFGQESSRGCVGLPPDTAKLVYDWTPIGTPISIYG